LEEIDMAKPAYYDSWEGGEHKKVPFIPDREMVEFLNSFLGWGDFDPDDPELDYERLFKHYDRRVYKSTACGAWMVAIPPGERKVGEEKQTWHAQIVQDGDKAKVISLKKGAEEPAWSDIPKRVLEYFLLEEGDQPRIMGFPWSRVRELSDDEDNMYDHLEEKTIATCKIDVPKYEPHRGGVQIGSIVEGAEQTCEVQELYWPFTHEEFHQAVKAVEAEAHDIWMQTHGCDACKKHWIAEYGEDAVVHIESIGQGDAVWDECPECEGHGIII
jgi:hypothetical protein